MENHIQIASRLKLCFELSSSTGSFYWTPEGTQLINDLLGYLMIELKREGYKEIKTPELYNCSLWHDSGYLENYMNNMYIIKHTEDELFENILTLKPMNCIGHAMMFQQLCQSERQLPLRLTENCSVHRNEVSESLDGLFRLRQFTQDDGHIFCTVEQIESEIKSIINLMTKFYKLFNLQFSAVVSTKPNKYVGTDQIWEDTESMLKEYIIDLDPNYQIKEGNGAFYGPKIDVFIIDSINRSWQCGTIQLDFYTGSQLGLQYEKIGIEHKGEYETPVIIHRGIMGSVERFIGILLEHTQGCLPYWLSSRQIYMTIAGQTGTPCEPKIFNYVKHIEKVFQDNSIHVNINTSESLMLRVSKAVEQGFHYIFIIGTKEANTNTINYRCRNNNYSNINATIEDVFKQIEKEYDFLKETENTDENDIKSTESNENHKDTNTITHDTDNDDSIIGKLYD